MDPNDKAKLRMLSFESEKRELVAPIRAEVGWPTDPDDYERIDGDLMWSYIEALENALTAERWMRQIGAI